jgi:hypothetical protein
VRALRILRNVLLGVGAVAGTLAVLIGVVIGGWWLSATQPWYDWDVVRQLRSGPGTGNPLWPDLTPQVAALFPQGTNADTARSVLRSNGFACASTTAAPGGDVQLTCTRETHDMLFCVARYTVGLVVDEGRRVTGQSGSSYVACI